MSSKGPSISDLLQDSLNVIAEENDSSTKKGGGQTASSLLLNVYKDKLAAKGDVLKVQEPEKKPVSLYLNQLGDSIDQSGVEWKGMFGKAKAKSDLQVINPPHHKDKLKNKEKGQNYKDRFNEKISSNSNRKKRMDKLGSSY